MKRTIFCKASMLASAVLLAQAGLYGMSGAQIDTLLKKPKLAGVGDIAALKGYAATTAQQYKKMNLSSPLTSNQMDSLVTAYKRMRKSMRKLPGAGKRDIQSSIKSLEATLTDADRKNGNTVLMDAIQGTEGNNKKPGRPSKTPASSGDLMSVPEDDSSQPDLSIISPDTSSPSSATPEDMPELKIETPFPKKPSSSTGVPAGMPELNVEGSLTGKIQPSYSLSDDPKIKEEKELKVYGNRLFPLLDELVKSSQMVKNNATAGDYSKENLAHLIDVIGKIKSLIHEKSSDSTFKEFVENSGKDLGQHVQEVVIYCVNKAQVNLVAQDLWSKAINAGTVKSFAYFGTFDEARKILNNTAKLVQSCLYPDMIQAIDLNKDKTQINKITQEVVSYMNSLVNSVNNIASVLPNATKMGRADVRDKEKIEFFLKSLYILDLRLPTPKSGDIALFNEARAELDPNFQTMGVIPALMLQIDSVDFIKNSKEYKDTKKVFENNRNSNKNLVEKAVERLENLK